MEECERVSERINLVELFTVASSFQAQIKRTVMSVVVFVGPYLSCLYLLSKGRQCRHTCRMGHCVDWVLKLGGEGRISDLS